MATTAPFVRAPASSANLGPGFDVLGMAVDLYADVGCGPPPAGAVAIDGRHPARVAFGELGGTGPLWLRTSIPMGRGLGFSGAVRVAAAALAAVDVCSGSPTAIEEASDAILSAAARLEGHGDNAAASLHGGVVAWIERRAIPLRVGPTLGSAAVVAWVPDVVTSTDRSRRGLSATLPRAAAVHNIGRSIQLALAIERDDPALLTAATADRIHQRERLARIEGGDTAIAGGVEAGAWCGWLSGSGPTVALLCPADRVADVVAALPRGGHSKQLAIDRIGARLVEA